MARKYISIQIKNEVITRSNGRCEYCLSLKKYSSQPFQMEHIFPVSLGGKSTLENLAHACGGCNGLKHIKTNAFDPITGLLVPLFHPRNDKWDTHFYWTPDYKLMIGLTPTGRATINLLQLNREEIINLRTITLLTKEHPPV